ncbi:Alpha/Beta hydrolase protein [Naematelia encephala]|uniref:Alpha/Beta hydrolase protein n=1 Tax=Naematelia encephala TaxID=71784 RepID=A0A1Y2B4J7_9TREE|nr:Alpha/Beta hydrolase protein [Naematelia encephala]
MPTFPNFAYETVARQDGSGELAYKVLPGPANGGSIPFVMITGLAASGLVDWFPMVEYLSKFRTILVMDNRGIGRSSSKDEETPLTVTQHVKDIDQLVRLVGWKEIDLLGFSMGGSIVQGVLAEGLLGSMDLSFKVRRVILASTAARFSSELGLDSHPEWDALFKPSPDPEERVAVAKQLIQEDYDPAFCEDSANQPLLGKRAVEYGYVSRPGGVVREQLRMAHGSSFLDMLPKIPESIGVLSLHGSLDQTVSQEHQLRIISSIKHAQSLTFPCGHSWFDYFGEEHWAQVIGNFLDGVA